MKDVETIKVFDAESVVASGTAESDAIDSRHLDGVCSVQYEITGDGTLTLEYLLSLDGVNYITPSGATEIGTSLTKLSGTAGKDVLEFTPEAARYMKILATETGTADTAILTLTLGKRTA